MEKAKKIMNRRRQREQSQTCLNFAERQGDAALLKQQLPRLTNQHINVGFWLKCLLFAGLFAVLGFAVANSGLGTMIGIGAGFMIVRFVLCWIFRLLKILLYIILILLILSLIIL